MADCHPLNTRPKRAAGAYELCDMGGDVVYIGRSENLPDRINDHDKNPEPCVKQRATGYRYWIGNPVQLEIERFRAYKASHGGKIPVCNTQDPSL